MNLKTTIFSIRKRVINYPNKYMCRSVLHPGLQHWDWTVSLTRPISGRVNRSHWYSLALFTGSCLVITDVVTAWDLSLTHLRRSEEAFQVSVCSAWITFIRFLLKNGSMVIGFLFRRDLEVGCAGLLMSQRAAATLQHEARMSNRPQDLIQKP